MTCILILSVYTTKEISQGPNVPGSLKYLQRPLLPKGPGPRLAGKPIANVIQAYSSAASTAASSTLSFLSPYLSPRRLDFTASWTHWVPLRFWVSAQALLSLFLWRPSTHFLKLNTTVSLWSTSQFPQTKLRVPSSCSWVESFICPYSLGCILEASVCITGVGMTCPRHSECSTYLCIPRAQHSIWQILGN